MASDRTEAALTDLEELEAQRRAGLVDDATADRLWARYAREALAHAEPHAEPHAPPDDDQPTGAPPRGGGPWVRRLGALTLAAAAVGAATLGLSTDERAPGGFVTGNEAVAVDSPTSPNGGRDLSQVTNEELEQVVAQNPDIVAMRIRLAHRYLDDGDLDLAVDHYLQVLEREDDPEAMSHLGWILFSQGRIDLAEPLLGESRRLAPQDPETMWFRANLLLYGRDDPTAAVPLLEGLLRRDDVVGAERSEATSALRDARDRLEDTP